MCWFLIEWHLFFKQKMHFSSSNNGLMAGEIFLRLKMILDHNSKRVISSLHRAAIIYTALLFAQSLCILTSYLIECFGLEFNQNIHQVAFKLSCKHYLIAKTVWSVAISRDFIPYSETNLHQDKYNYL